MFVRADVAFAWKGRPMSARASDARPRTSESSRVEATIHDQGALIFALYDRVKALEVFVHEILP